jgi:hypothetical protein
VARQLRCGSVNFDMAGFMHNVVLADVANPGKALFPAFWSATPCASPPPRPSIFSHYSFLVHRPTYQNDRHLLAHAMASDFTLAWKFSQREQFVCCVFFVMDQTPHPYLA